VQETAESIEMPFGADLCDESKDHVLDGTRSPRKRVHFGGHR